MSIQRLSNAGQSGYRYKTLIAGITPVASVPTIGTATALTYSTASVEFTAPGAYAGSTYTATSSPGGFTGTSASSPITVSGLSESTAYTFTVTATNATGTSSPSAASNSITTPVAWSPESGYDSLATVALSADTSTITFAGIPSGYKHLQVRWVARSTSATSTDYIYPMRFNGDTGANYSSHYINGNGSTIAASGNADQNGFNFYGDFPAASASSGLFGTAIMDILDYASTDKYKTVRTLAGFDANGSGQAFFNSSSWRSTSAISSFSLAFNGGNIAQNSSFALYGVK